ncbi:heavy-metal-associated domain-containing protein [Bacillus sp. FJAT-49736]|uniref:heavy-metal-associated domain-containing protein n=1 Tax=Bacillus sp. FJAT-49736 TaxID=2833582 RepID=UPI001BC8E7C9|nr:heavy-metal-associated domain-containing protein [Bacillus sp. FJAT-49736]MBS4171668.1 heavy-metal-associated domain-containing protein [Bacillus sp. FJAT-49736]
MTQETFIINKATSEESVQEIEQALSQLRGVERVLMDIDDGEVKIEFDENIISSKRILSAIQECSIHI